MAFDGKLETLSVWWITLSKFSFKFMYKVISQQILKCFSQNNGADL